MDISVEKTGTGVHVYISEEGHTISDFLLPEDTIMEKSLWREGQGDDLPDIDREVIALQDIKGGSFRVVFAHRPNPEGYTTGEGESIRVFTYDEGGWNMPDIIYWLDYKLPKGLEQ